MNYNKKTDRYSGWLSAARYCVYDKKHKTQVAIAKDCEIESQSLNAILKGRQGKRASDTLQDKISLSLGYTYEEMLSLGRWILDKKDPTEWRGLNLSSIAETTADTERSDAGKVFNPSQQVRYEDFTPISKYKARLSGGHGSLEDSDQIEANILFRTDFIRTKGNPLKMALFEVTGDSMQPFLYEGDVVLVDLQQNDPHAIIDGKAYAFREDHTIKVKRLSRQGATILVTSENSDMFTPYKIENGDFHLIGRVVWVGHEVR